MNTILLLSLISSAFLILTIFIQRRTIKLLLENNKKTTEFQLKDMQIILKDQIELFDAIQSLNERYEDISNQANKLYLLVKLLRSNQSYSIARTMTDILESLETPTQLEINIDFLGYLKEEYLILRNHLQKQRDSLEKNIDFIQINHLSNSIDEIDNILILLSTISNDSSASYIEDIIKNVAISLQKLYGINNL